MVANNPINRVAAVRVRDFVPDLDALDSCGSAAQSRFMPQVKSHYQPARRVGVPKMVEQQAVAAAFDPWSASGVFLAFAATFGVTIAPMVKISTEGVRQ